MVGILTEEQSMLRDTAKKLCQRMATPEHIRKLDRERLYPYELYDAWIEAGMFQLPFPEEYGGLGRSVTDLAIVAEELSVPSSDVIMAFGGSMPIPPGGTAQPGGGASIAGV